MNGNTLASIDEASYNGFNHPADDEERASTVPLNKAVGAVDNNPAQAESFNDDPQQCFKLNAQKVPKGSSKGEIYDSLVSVRDMHIIY